MATVNKDFRIKSGLVVEGANATVNGEDIITTGSSTDNLPEGTTNLYFTPERAATAVADEISTAVDTAINNLSTTDIEEGSNQYFTEQRVLDTVSGNLGTGIVYSAETAGNVFHIDENVVATRSYADDAASNAASTAQTNAQTYADTAAYNAQMNAEGYVDAQLTNYTTTANLDNTVDGLGYLKSGDLAGYATETYADNAADTAESNANTYTDNKVGNTFGKSVVEYLGENYTTTANLDTAVDGLGYLKSADLTDYATKTYADDAAATAEYMAKTYADGVASTAENNAKSYADTAVANLVDGAPALLDTLNELAAAIADNPNYATDVANLVAGKQDTLTAGANIDITGATISVTGLDSTDISDFNTAALSATASAYDAAGAAATAEQNAKDYADLNFVNVTDLPGQLDDYVPLTQKGVANGVATLDANGFVPAAQLDIDVTGDISTAIDALTTDDIEEGSTNLYFTDARAVDAITTETIYPPAVVINNLSKQVAATQTVGMIATVNGLTWAKSEYKSAKLTVKAKTASHTQLSEVLVTLDGSDNVAITEYGIVYTDTELAVVSADVSGSDVRIRVTTLFPSTDVTVVGTLLV